MNIDKILCGHDVPRDVNVIIEVPRGSSPVKYEMDKDSGALMVDRLLQTPMYYPAHYGFVPHTLSDDGDPIDVLVVCDAPIVPGAVIRARPVGVLKMEDEKGGDEKLVAVPYHKIDPSYASVESYKDLPENLIRMIEHFFTHYKDLEKDKWVKILGWGDRADAERMMSEAVARYQGK